MAQLSASPRCLNVWQDHDWANIFAAIGKRDMLAATIPIRNLTTWWCGYLATAGTRPRCAAIIPRGQTLYRHLTATSPYCPERPLCEAAGGREIRGPAMVELKSPLWTEAANNTPVPALWRTCGRAVVYGFVELQDPCQN